MRTKTPNPPEWQVLMDQKGLSSRRKLAAAAGTDHAAVGRLILGNGNTSDETVKKVAVALGVDVSKIYELQGTHAPDADLYKVPSEANRLTYEQKNLVTQIIRELAKTNPLKAVVPREDGTPIVREASSNYVPENERDSATEDRLQLLRDRKAKRAVERVTMTEQPSAAAARMVSHQASKHGLSNRGKRPPAT